MVDILQEVDDSQAGKRRRFPLALVVCVVAVVVSVLVLFILQSRCDPPIGRELSKVSGVGIVRRGILHSGKRSSNEVGSRSGKIYRDGYELIYALCDATDQQVAIVQKASLPEGKYRVSAMTDTGGSETLLKMLCVAYSKAFDVSVSEKEIETDVYVMTCPNRSALRLEETTGRTQGFDGNFRGGGSVNTWFDAIFTADMSNLANYAGYMIRKSWERTEADFRDNAMGTIVIDETGLSGYYTGKLSWRFYVPGALIKELTARGLVFSKQRRKVKVVVIE